MVKIFDYVLKYYSPIEEDGKLLMADNRWGYIDTWAYYHAGLKVKEFLSFGDKVTIEPLREECYLEGNKLTTNGYKVTANGFDHIWRIEPRVRERKSQAWRGL